MKKLLSEHIPNASSLTIKVQMATQMQIVRDIKRSMIYSCGRTGTSTNYHNTIHTLREVLQNIGF